MDEQTRQVLHEATGHVLERTGGRIDSRAALELLAGRGVRVDWSTRRVHPTLDHVAQALKRAPAGFALYGRRAKAPLAIGGENVYVIAGGASVRVLTLEGRHEDGTWEHLRQFTALLDALPNVHILLNQVDPPGTGRSYYRRIARELFLGSGKPFCLQAGGAADVRALVEMAAAIRGSREAVAERPLFMTGANAEPPLAIPECAAEVLIAAGEAAIPSGIGDYLMMGSTGPITLAGALVQRNAVQLSALILSQFSRPGAPFYYVAASGSADLRTLDPRMADPRTVRILRYSAELGRSYGVPVCGLSTTDSRMPDGQAACERMATFLAGVRGGAQLIQGPTSMMDQMMLSSFAQAVIDDDIVGYALAQAEVLDVSSDALALEPIHEVVERSASGDFGFAAHAHTVAHLREQRWQPLVFDTGSFAAWQKAGSPSLVERATSVARRLMAQRPEELDKRVAAEIDRIAEAEG